MRAFAIAIFVSASACAACAAHVETAPAVTIARPQSIAPTPVDRTLAIRVDRARDAIGEKRFVDASKMLVAIVCPDQDVHGEPELARCPVPASAELANAWELVGQLASDDHLAIDERAWSSARRVVSRWSRYEQDVEHGGGQLAIAELAFLRATSAGGPDAGRRLYTLGTIRYRRGRYGPALTTFSKVLELRLADARAEATDYASLCVAQRDWDGDGEPDAAHGFARPEVRAALASNAPWVAEIYARAIDAMRDDEACDDARAGLAELIHRFPTSPHIGRLAKNLPTTCP